MGTLHRLADRRRPAPAAPAAPAERLDPAKRPVVTTPPPHPRTHRPAARSASAPEPLWREKVGRALRVERTARGERIADVAERAGVSPQYLSEVERGRKDPSSEVLSALAGALGLTVADVARSALVTRTSSGRPASSGRGPEAHLLAA
ncbi:MAG: helix-turn-helix domain-containing protein [Dermatophilaceae bacterium]